MRRIFILLLMAALLAACVTGCNEKPEGNITTPATKAEATDPPVGTPEPEEETEIYAQILSDYRALVQFRLSDDFESRWNNGDHIDLSDTLDNTVKNTDGHWSNMVVEMTNGLNAPTMASYGYALRDINGDSVPELFWVREYQDILAVFTVHDGNVLLLDAFGSKYRCTLTDDNTLCTRSSGGVYSVYSVQILTKEGTLECLKQFGINGDTHYEIIDGETVTIDTQRFDQLQTEYPFEDAGSGAPFSAPQY